MHICMCVCVCMCVYVYRYTCTWISMQAYGYNIKKEIRDSYYYFMWPQKFSWQQTGSRLFCYPTGSCYSRLCLFCTRVVSRLWMSVTLICSLVFHLEGFSIKQNSEGEQKEITSRLKKINKSPTPPSLNPLQNNSRGPRLWGTRRMGLPCPRLTATPWSPAWGKRGFSTAARITSLVGKSVQERSHLRQSLHF